MLKLDEILIIIPSLNPDNKISLVVNSLQDIGFNNILLIDDGSDLSNKHYFKKLNKENNCKLITHDINKGKGRALKTAFNYALENKDKFQAVITVDGDNQHKASDVLKTAQAMLPNSITLGIRTFTATATEIPLRSRAGNIASAFAFRIISGSNIKDTQTGLRGIYIDNLTDIVAIDGERFEFEMNVLLHLKKLNLTAIQIPIETVYINENETSHFNPILDSFKVFKTILSFLGSSIFCFIIDMALYSILIYLFNQSIFIATLVSRVVSSIVNFTINYKVVFNSKEKVNASIIKYYALAIVQMLASSIGTTFLNKFIFNPIIAKIIIDFILFMISYLIQKKFIFRQ